MRSDDSTSQKQTTLTPDTFHDYLLKYYGEDHRGDSSILNDSEEAEGYHSDGPVDYNDHQ